MIELVRSLQESVRKLDDTLARAGARTIGPGKISTELRGLVDHYFCLARPQLEKAGVPEKQLAPCDEPFKRVLTATAGETGAKDYRQLLRAILDHLDELEKTALQRHGLAGRAEFDPKDRQIIDALRLLLPSAALSYEQAVLDLEGEERLSWRGPATDLREAMRECLDHLAPDKDVEAQPGYKKEPDTRGPTMKQKVRFILKARTSAAGSTTEDAVEVVESALGGFVRSVYTRSSISTHTARGKDEVLRVRECVRLVLRELLALP